MSARPWRALAFFLPMLAWANAEYAPQMSLRTHTGRLTNEAPDGGTTVLFGGVGLAYHYFLGPRWALGVAFRGDFGEVAVPLKAYTAELRYHFWNDGTRESLEGGGESFEGLAPWTLYGGATVSYVNYYFGIVSGTEPLEGTTASFEGLLGLEFRLTNHYSFLIENTYTLLPFAATDPEVSFRSNLLHAGFTYIW
jgi:hypothetical protein